MKGKSKKDILGYEEEDELTEEEKKKETFNPVPPLYLTLLIFLLALLVRMVFLLFFTKIDEPNLGDVYHHWQVAYLTKTIGFKHGFLRLWDFKGMEYYWGLLHPLILIMGFVISRSVSIVVPRIVSTLAGSLSVTLIFLIVARYFNKKAAFACAVFLSLMPTAVFHETLGLQEPLGLFFLLAGVFLFHNHTFLAGFSWMLAGMTRAEYWIFGAGLILVVLLRERNFDRKVMALLGYMVPCILYMKYLLDYTENPIYPVYWNYLAVVTGVWSSKTRVAELLPDLQMTRLFCRILMASSLIACLVVFWKKFKAYLFLLLGFAYTAFAFYIFSFGAYLAGFGKLRVESYPGYIDKLWIGKVFAFPWNFLGILVIIFLLYFLPKKMGKLGTVVGGLIFLVGLGASQFIWPSIDKHYLQFQGQLQENVGDYKELANYIADNYTGRGVILLPAQAEVITYYLVNEEGISGEKLATSFYSPFYYYEGEDPFLEWEIFREEIIDWLKETNAELFLVGKSREDNDMLKLEEGKLFEFVGSLKRSYRLQSFKLYKVTINEE